MGSTRENIFIKMVLDAWFSKLDKANQIFNTLSNEDFEKEVAPGRSRGVYLLGHLTAVHDKMIPLLGFGESIHPDLWDTFVVKPDKAVAELPSIETLKSSWTQVNNTLGAKFISTSVDSWFEKHSAISESDFAIEPHRNKLNLIINRTNHLDNHIGQLVFLKRK